jgi:UDP-N-acetylglucosamine 1-carboxyvinyltransferase
MKGRLVGMREGKEEVLVIRGGRRVGGEIRIAGSKNAALPLLAAAALVDEEVCLRNVPDITDVKSMLRLLEAVGAQVRGEADTVTVRAGKLLVNRLSAEEVRRFRGSVLLLAPLLLRCAGKQTLRFPRPGGDLIGARPLSSHWRVLQAFGVKVKERGEILLSGKPQPPRQPVLPRFSVTATELALMLAAALPSVTRIELAAAEPHVTNLVELLTRMGAQIAGRGTHTLIVRGVSPLRGAEVNLIPDDLEVITFAILAAATRSRLRIRPVIVPHVRMALEILAEMGVSWRFSQGMLEVSGEGPLRATKVQTLPHPGLQTDLQPLFGVLATQADGTTLIHDPLYEKRFGYIAELQKMGANAVICDPHRVLITGPTPLRGREVNSLDIRAGATMVVAGLVAEGVTVLHEAQLIDRGYGHLAERLRGIGALIQRLPRRMWKKHKNTFLSTR